MFWLGLFNRLPSVFRPDLIAMQSSPVLKKQFLMSTSVHDSGSHPSLFGPWPSVVTPMIETFLQRTGWRNHMGEFLKVTPSTRTLVQRYGTKKLGRRFDPSPKMRCSTGTPSSAILSSLFRAAPWFCAPG